MQKRRYILLATGAALNVAVVLALMTNRQWRDLVSLDIYEGVVVGLTFGQAIVAGAWAALGPLRAIIRIPAAILWTMAVTLALSFQLGGSLEWHVVLTLGGAMLTQMLVVQFLLGLVCALTRTRLSAPAAPGTAPAVGEYQFGIRELLLLTTGVAVLLGLARWLVDYLNLSISDGPEWHALMTLLLIICCSTLWSLPIIIALLLPRRVIVAFVIALVFVAGVTLLEQSLYRMLKQNLPGTHLSFFGPLNGLQSLWVVVSLLLVRFAGYRQVRRGSQPASALAGTA